jgi:Putative beta barrel porin-7 (BBP7)
MRNLLCTAMFALAAIPGFAPAADDILTPRAPLPTSVSVSQAQSPPSPLSVESAPYPRAVFDSTPGSDCGVPCAKADWDCGPPRCFWVSGEYLLWWIKDSQVPALITTGVPGATTAPGVLGQPGTRVLFGGSDVDNQVREGGRVSGGFWLDNCQTFGIEGSYFFLGSRSVRFNDASSGALGSAMISRPFFDVLSATQNSQLVAFPGLASGEIHLSSSSRLQGAEINMLCNPCCTPCCDVCADQACPSGDTARHSTHCNTYCGCNYWVSLLGGFRYLQLDEGLGIAEITQVNPALPAGSPIFGGSTIAMSDQFDTHNYFYGAQIGAQAELCWGRMFVDFLGKVALGATHEVVDIRGVTAITSPGGTTVVTPAGFLASGSNSGHFTRDEFAVLPEVGINVGCQITTHLRAFVGYTFLYCSSVVRPGDQVDVGLSGTQIPTDTRFNPQAGPARPALVLRDTDFWAQGVNFGLEFRY